MNGEGLSPCHIGDRSLSRRSLLRCMLHRSNFSLRHRPRRLYRPRHLLLSPRRLCCPRRPRRRLLRSFGRRLGLGTYAGMLVGTHRIRVCVNVNVY